MLEQSQDILNWKNKFTSKQIEDYLQKIVPGETSENEMAAEDEKNVNILLAALSFLLNSTIQVSYDVLIHVTLSKRDIIINDNNIGYTLVTLEDNLMWEPENRRGSEA
ncbi:hypothetical protein ACJX0J_037033 [Zea mays]